MMRGPTTGGESREGEKMRTAGEFIVESAIELTKAGPHVAVVIEFVADLERLATMEGYCEYDPI